MVGLDVAPMRRRWLLAGLGLWIGYAVVITILTLVRRPEHTLIPLYDNGSFDFWLRRDEPANYDTGYYYLPSARVLFTPFAFAGVLGGLAWRFLTLGLITLAARAWAAVLTPDHRQSATILILVLLIATSAGALRAGQFDASTWSLMALGAAAVARGALTKAALVLGLALALKPTAIVAVLMFGALWPPLGLRLLPIVALTLALPFVNPDWAYVERLYRATFDGVMGAMPESGHWRDLTHLLASMGVPTPYPVMTALRCLAALLAFAGGVIARRRLPHPQAAFAVFMLSALYLLLFNPRIEGLGYAGLAMAAAPISARMLFVEGRPLQARLLAALCIAPGFIGVTPSTLRTLGPWLFCLLAIVFLVLVAVRRVTSASAWTALAGDRGDHGSVAIRKKA
jgi:hypothetical protein